MQLWLWFTSDKEQTESLVVVDFSIADPDGWSGTGEHEVLANKW